MNRMTGSFRDKWKHLTSFGPKFFFATLRCAVTKNSVASLEHKERIILKYLKKKYGHVVRKYSQGNVKLPDERKKPDIREPIWVLWLQGAEQMPEIVRLCQKSKERYASGHSVILLNRDNLKEYVTLPESIWGMLDRGEITLQHFSDITRVKLLRDYGGFWLDVTFLCTSPLEDRLFKLLFYSIKQEFDPSKQWFASRRRWIGGAMGGQSQNLLFSFLHELQIEFFTNERNLIDYLIMDYMIELAYESFPQVKEMIDAVDIAQGDCYYLCKHLGDTVNDTLLKEIAERSSFINKLDWRTDTSGFSADSLYHYLLDEYS